MEVKLVWEWFFNSFLYSLMSHKAVEILLCAGLLFACLGCPERPPPAFWCFLLAFFSNCSLCHKRNRSIQKLAKKNKNAEKHYAPFHSNHTIGWYHHRTCWEWLVTFSSEVSLARNVRDILARIWQRSGRKERKKTNSNTQGASQSL